ncbi:NmrA family NAD(P)-binding protein [Companilactobacillus halodurans]|uniref:SDR family NAD(P)-dependent oxidoreductase n=1 Tax=Companilactobacillus halodurans TaxID=2584183 RepID=A0A5P0ZQQ9_9LACO|nr:NmrA family NAD(P)-binding protein [Companilactobacillus halodurans]MQS76211.1 SDR family NAD(P)-dependent oxidoreductase [Companilactobacillus halodurans]MQS97439.1 SDR family NAD(P)-dependent oxidoreductase [Companilactobacillus halodurans]
MEKFLIIGATGNIGFPLVQYLNQNSDVNLVVGAHNVTKTQATFNNYRNLEVKHFDFLDPNTFNDSFSGVSKVFFVRPPQLANPKVDMLPFLKFAKNQRIQQIIFVSLIGVEKNPMTPHHKIEKMIEELNLPHTFIRPSFFMQNLNTTHQFDIQKHHDLFIPAGNAKTSFIDTRDIGEVAAISLLDSKYLGQKLNITGPMALTYSEIAQIMSEILPFKVTYSKPSLLKFRKTMLHRGLKKDYVNVMVMLYLITQLGNAKTVTKTAEKVLGRKPHSIQTYIKDYQNDFE